jgi:hypothetical protein
MFVFLPGPTARLETFPPPFPHRTRTAYTCMLHVVIYSTTRLRFFSLHTSCMNKRLIVEDRETRGSWLKYEVRYFASPRSSAGRTIPEGTNFYFLHSTVVPISDLALPSNFSFYVQRGPAQGLRFPCLAYFVPYSNR